jgi:hypothetical protein
VEQVAWIEPVNHLAGIAHLKDGGEVVLNLSGRRSLTGGATRLRGLRSRRSPRCLPPVISC